jgi:hypothetical protein
VEWHEGWRSKYLAKSNQTMTETPSTLNVPLVWAAKEERQDELLPTGFFLFKEDEGRVVLRSPVGNREPVLESRTAVADSFATCTVEKASTNAKSRRVPQTRLLRSQPDQRYILLKKYEGFVTTRGEDSFSARLFESNSDYPVVEAEFELEELSETDRELAVEGAPLVWTIGYAYEGSTRKRESLIYLRRIPAWSDKELEKGRAAADDLTRAIRWE